MLGLGLIGLGRWLLSRISFRLLLELGLRFWLRVGLFSVSVRLGLGLRFRLEFNLRLMLRLC